MPNQTSLEEINRLLEFDALSAQKWTKEGEIEDWVHKYLLTGDGGSSNPEFSEGLKREKRWWNGPVEINLTDLSPAVGTQPGMEYVVDKDHWHLRISQLAESFTIPSSLPPLIVEYRDGELSIRDGNTRFGAMDFLAWPKCWVVIWYNSEEDYLQHSSLLFS